LDSRDAPHELFGNKNKTAEALTTIMSDLLGRTVEDVDRDTDLRNDIGLDSIHGVEICNRVARDYGVSVHAEDVDAVETFGELVDLIASSPSESSRGGGSGRGEPA